MDPKGARKIKVFLCITKSNWGGAQKYVYDLATNLPKNEFDISVLLGGDGELAGRLRTAGIRTVMLPYSQRDINIVKVFLTGFSLISIFRKEKPDIVHLNSSQMGGSGALAARIAGIKKIIFTGHGWAFNEDRPIWQKMLIRFFHIITILLCHSTIAVSEITKKQIGAPWNKKMTVIRNGLTMPAFLEKQAAREAIIQKAITLHPEATAAFAKNPTWIGTISELHRTKGLSYAFEAVAGLSSPAVFIVIGDGQEKESLTAYIREHKLADKIFILGRVEMANTLLKAFDIATLTSITEALPYFLLEAGMASVSVIASTVGGIPEIIEDGKSGRLVAARDSTGIQRAMETYMAKPQEAAALGRNLSLKISREFSIERMVQETIALYRI